MGKHQGWVQPPSGLLPNGLLPSEGPSLIRALDLERWSKAEEKTAELIACIQPNQPSEIRRNAVADYVKRLIMQCFPCQVFTFGSVPLKTYLPDGDIDLTAFSENPTVKENWAQQVRDILESEEKNENAEFRVKEVQYIQAEVKIIKCLVENIVVDISFNQLGGLCTLCFLEEVDNLIDKDHLFKRSIILIKAWCYYESRILGAHHGLISTYALETLVLYIFNVYDKDFVGPLEVLYRFLEFFSKYDWENFCVSLKGPVRISSLPDVAGEPPRNDDKELLLNERFLDACTAVYGVPSGNQENQGQSFASKHFNVIDPLRVTNNLGRSVSRGNYFRIRSAFSFGAKKLARLLDCPKEDLLYEMNGFFMNTWDRHGSGHRPDAPRNDLWRSRLSNKDGQENQRSSSSRKGEAYLSRDSRVEGNRGSHGSSTQHIESTSRATTNASSVSRALGQKNYGNSSNSRTSDATVRWESNSKQGGNTDKDQKFSRMENVNNIQGRYLFARTHSSPELTDSYSEASSQGRRSRAPESGKNQPVSARLDNARKNSEPGLNDNYSFTRHNISSQQQIDASAAAADSKSVSNSYHDDGARLSIVSEEFESVSGTQGEDIMNMAAASLPIQSFHKQIHLPLNFSSGHLPLSLVPMGYAQRNMAGMMPMIEPWGAANMTFPHGLVPSQALAAHYFPGVNMAAPNPEDTVDAADQNLGSNSVEAEHDLWQEQDQGGSARGGFDLDNGNLDAASSPRNYDPSSRVVSSSSYRGHQRSFRENRGVANRGEEHSDALQYQGSREREVYLDDRSTSSRSVRSTHSSPFRSKTSSESSWDGSSANASKPARERKGGKGGSTAIQTIVYGKELSISEHSSAPADEDWNSASTIGTEMIERNPGPQQVASVQMPGYEPPQASGSDSMMPFGPVLIGPGSRQRPGDPGVIFYPTGPPVPFVAMLPFYNFPGDAAGSSEASTSQFGGEDGNESSQNFDSSLRFEHSEELSASSNSNSMAQAGPVEAVELRPDILNSDFTSHWHNLQYGRLCQNTRFPAAAPAPPMIYPSPNVLSPVYVQQGQLPWDSPRRPLSANVNLFSHLMSNGTRIVPVAAPIQPVSNGPASVYHVDEMPRFRGGTGTYLPNLKASPRERHSSSRRGNFSYDRSDHHHHNERDGNWNLGVKSRASGRGHGRNQSEKPIPRTEHHAVASENQSNRQWSSQYNMQGSFQYHSQNNNNNAMQMNLVEGGGNNLATYGMYPVNPSTGSSSNGPPVPPVFMFYPYDRSSHGYGSGSEQQQLGIGGEGLQQQTAVQGGRSGHQGVEEQIVHGHGGGGGPPRSSPDQDHQPSSPPQRR